MAEKILKGINFPGLEDTYLIPEVDNTLSKSGQAADAKIVGEALAGKQPIGNYIKTINGNAPDENGDIVIEISSDEMEQVQSDWDVNDEANAAYIKNKPFGEDDNGIKYLNNKYLDFMQSLTDYIINPRKQKLELNDDVWLTNDYVGYIYPTEEEWQNLLKIWNESNQIAAGATISLNGGSFTGYLEPISYDENNIPTAFQCKNSNASIAITIGKNSLKDKVLLPEVSVDLKVGGNGVAQLQDNPTNIGATEDFLFEIDKEYIVTWDGIEYEVTGTYLNSSNWSAIGVGNIGGEGTEPFYLATAVDSGQYHIEISSSIDSSDATHQVSIREKMPTYLGIVFIMPEEAYLIKDARVNIFPRQTVELDYMDSTYGAYTTFIAPPPFTLRKDKNYTVVWDDVEYPVTGIDTSSLFPGSVAVGDGRAVGYPGNGEPFIIMNTNNWAGGNSQTIAGITFLSLVDTAPTSHTIEIYEEDSTYINIYLYTGNSESNWQIKKNYLPADLGGSVSWNDLEDKPFDSIEGEEILPLTTYEDFSLYPEFGCYVQDVQVDFTLEVGESYIVNWDGAEYTCVAQDVSATIPDTIAMGNFGNFGFPNTGEPFIIGSNVNQYGTWGIFIPLTDIDDTGSHSVRISKPPIVKKLDEKYLPDIMEVDAFILRSSTEGSSKRFKITIDDTGTLSVEELGG